MDSISALLREFIDSKDKGSLSAEPNDMIIYRLVKIYRQHPGPNAIEIMQTLRYCDSDFNRCVSAGLQHIDNAEKQTDLAKRQELLQKAEDLKLRSAEDLDLAAAVSNGKPLDWRYLEGVVDKWDMLGYRLLFASLKMPPSAYTQQFLYMQAVQRGSDELAREYKEKQTKIIRQHYGFTHPRQG